MEINCKISSELDNLAKYNEQYYWIPGPENITPSKKLLNLRRVWNTTNTMVENNEGLLVPRPISNKLIFVFLPIIFNT